MRASATWLGFLAMACGPVVGLLALMVAGELRLGPGLIVLGICLAIAWILARVWSADMARIRESLRMAATGDQRGLATLAGQASLSATERVIREVERLARGQGERMAQAAAQITAERAIIERLPDPLIVLGTDRGVRRANAAAHQAFGTDLAAVLRHPGLRAAIERATAPDAPAGHVQRAAVVLPVPVLREVQATVIGMGRTGDGMAGVAILSDRTRERAMERTRADFVANASHELRTPLASLMGFIDTLRGPAADDPPAQARFLGIMAEQAERMNRLIDDLLSLSRIELVEHQPPGERVDLAALVQRMVDSFEPRVAARRMTLRSDLAADLPPVPGDEDQLAQVVQNLLDNAVKYGRDGGTIRVRATSAVPAARFPARPGVLLSVVDDGFGIKREEIPRLTERFYRVDKGRSRTVGGTGLGLAIVKHVVNRHRGQLLIESDEGAGATFSVWLPLSRA